MSKVRINDLARELEVKSKSILDALTAVGVTEPKTHSSSIEADEADKVRAYFSGKRSSSSAVSKPPVEAKPAFNLSHISKPGDAARLILERKLAAEEARKAPRRPAAAPVPAAPAVVAKATPEAKPVSPASAPAAAAPAVPAPRRIVPQPRQHTQIVTPPAPPPAIVSKPPVGPVIARPPVVVAPPPSAHAAPGQPATTTQPSVAPPQAHPAADRPPVVAPAADVAATAKRAKPVAAPVAVPASPSVSTAPAVAPGATTAGESRDASAVAAASVESTAAVVEVGPIAEPVESAADTPVAEPPVRRIVMPQTGPRPIYLAPEGAARGIQRGRPIFERPRPQASGGPDVSSFDDGSGRTATDASDAHVPHWDRRAWTTWIYTGRRTARLWRAARRTRGCRRDAGAG